MSTTEAPAFTNAKTVMMAIDDGKPFDSYKDLVADGATFSAQAPALSDIQTVEAWGAWMKNFVENIGPDCRVEIKSCAWDAERRTASMFAVYHATHTGDGCPVPATNKMSHTDCVYVLQMNKDNKVEHFYKIWNDAFCMKELGWTD